MEEHELLCILKNELLYLSSTMVWTRSIALHIFQDTQAVADAGHGVQVVCIVNGGYGRKLPDLSIPCAL